MERNSAILCSMIKGIGEKVCVLGIGGISMSGISQILVKNGHRVVGFDKTPNEVFDCLKQVDIECYQDGEIEFCCDFDTLIYTVAISESDNRIVGAKKWGKQVLTRAEALKFIMDEYSMVVAVSGSHGKTTTTAIASSLCKSLENFTAHIGGVLNEGDSSLIIKGERGCFFTEACEYNRSFYQIFPNVGVILNTDLDHVDTYSSREEIIDAYIQFSNNIKANGILVLNLDDEAGFEIINRTKNNKEIITVSLKNPMATYCAKVISNSINGVEFLVYKNGIEYNRFRFYRNGEHNLYNALFAVVIANIMGIDTDIIKEQLSNFKGVKRRFQDIGKLNGARVIIDYAHHPHEIEKIIAEAKQLASGKVYACFQPHTYTRTKYFWGDFVMSLLEADNVIMYPIYSAREKPIRGVTSKRMAEDIRRAGGICYYASTAQEIKTYLHYFVEERDIVLIVGAGDIANIRLFD